MTRWPANLAVAVATVAVAAGCGGEKLVTVAKTVRPRGQPAQTLSVAKIGQEPISKASFERRLAIVAAENRETVPDAPRFRRCIAESPTPTQATARLFQACARRYAQLRAQALGQLISGDWLIGEAAAEGEPVSAGLAQSQFEQARRRLFPGQGQFAAYLSKTKKTVKDVLFDFEASQASKIVQHRVLGRLGSVTPAEAASYYARHAASFHVPERRDLEIVRTATEAEALRARRKIQAGASFASVVMSTKLEQPIDSREGRAAGVVPGFYKEAALNHAIFTARPNILSGPVKISLGYYIFVVERIHRAYQKTLAEAEPRIKQVLPALREHRALAEFISAWRARWRAKTVCSRGYIVPKCSEYHAPKGGSAEGALALE